MSPDHEFGTAAPAEDEATDGGIHEEIPSHNLVGEWVDVWADGRRVDSGRVDAVMPDGSILWLAADGATPRRIIEPTSRVHVRGEAGSVPE